MAIETAFKRDFAGRRTDLESSSHTSDGAGITIVPDHSEAIRTTYDNCSVTCNPNSVPDKRHQGQTRLFSQTIVGQVQSIPDEEEETQDYDVLTMTGTGLFR